MYMLFSPEEKKKSQPLERSQEQDLAQLGTDDLLPDTFKGSYFSSLASGSIGPYFRRTT